MVIWLIGISGAGKTTLGAKVHDYFISKNIKSFILDGDVVRNFYDNDLGFSKEDRTANIKRIMLSAYVLEKNKIIPIVCNISPFEELRNMARKKFDSYHEIYLKKKLEDAKKNDVKNIYENNIDKTELVGINLVFDKPLNSNLIINVDFESPDESFKKILNYITKFL
jgi:adenylylsulfate kinase-like enzyme